MPLTMSFEGDDLVQNCFVTIYEGVFNKSPALPKREEKPRAILGKATAKAVELNAEGLLATDSLIKQKKFIDAIKLVRLLANVDLKTAKEYVDQRKGQL